MRLHPRCHVIDIDGRFLLSRGRIRLELVDPVDADRARQVLAWLTGPTGPPPTTELGAFLGMLAELERAGLLVADDYTETWVSPPVHGRSSAPDLSALVGRTALVVGSGQSAGPLVSALQEAGATVLQQTEPPLESHLPGVDLVIAWADGPDLDSMAVTSAAAMRAGVACLPVFHLGDEGLVGPYGVAGRSACFRCWELRWLGMAETTTAEVALHAHLRRGGWRLESGWPSAAARHLADEAAALAARELGSRSPWGDMSITDFTTGRISRHHVEPHPGCGRCAAPFHEPDRPALPFPTGRSADSGRASLEELRPILDHRVGVAAIVEVEAMAEGTKHRPTPLAVAHARFASAHPEQVWYDSERWTHGAAPTPEGARLVAVAEALERYCGTFTPAPAVLASYEEISDDALWPPDLPLFSPRQYAEPGFPFDPFDTNQVHPWTWGFNVTRGRATLVPQDAVRYGPAPSRLLHESSSGVAAHTSPVAALLGATLEVVERDALMLVWLNRMSPPLVDLDEHPDPFLTAAQQEIDQSGYLLRVADLTTDIGIPVMLAIAVREDMAAPALTLGAGAALEPTTAARKAVRELLGGIRGWQAAEWSRPELLDVDSVHELADHARAYYHPAWLPRAEFLWSSRARAGLPAVRTTEPTAAEGVDECVNRLREAGLDLVAVDLTTPDVARRGMTVARAVVPGAQPIGFGRTGLRLGGRRLYQAPVRMGYMASEPTEASLNPDPHCYP